MKRTAMVIALALTLPAVPALAQTSNTNIEKKSSLLEILNLPRQTQESRRLGVPENDIQSILQSARQEKVPLGILTGTFEETNKAVREHGPIDNFGAFVQTKLKSGLRGRELAAAIHAEHAKRGKGKGHMKEKHEAKDMAKDMVKGKTVEASDKPGARPVGAKDVGAGRGESSEHGKAGEKAKPDAAGKGAKGKKTDSPGKSGAKGGSQ